jgi:hypothetical protein
MNMHSRETLHGDGIEWQRHFRRVTVALLRQCM